MKTLCLRVKKKKSDKKNDAIKLLLATEMVHDKVEFIGALISTPKLIFIASKVLMSIAHKLTHLPQCGFFFFGSLWGE